MCIYDRVIYMYVYIRRAWSRGVYEDILSRKLGKVPLLNHAP